MSDARRPRKPPPRPDLRPNVDEAEPTVMGTVGQTPRWGIRPPDDDDRTIIRAPEEPQPVTSRMGGAASQTRLGVPQMSRPAPNGYYSSSQASQAQASRATQSLQPLPRRDAAGAPPRARPHGTVPMPSPSYPGPRDSSPAHADAIPPAPPTAGYGAMPRGPGHPQQAYGAVPSAPITARQGGQAGPTTAGSSPPPGAYPLPYVPMRTRQVDDGEESSSSRRWLLVAGVLGALAVLGGVYVVKGRPGKPSAPSGVPSSAASTLADGAVRPLELRYELVPAPVVGDMNEDVVTVGSVLAPAEEAAKKRVIAIDGSTFAIAWLSPPVANPAPQVAVANSRVVASVEPKVVVVLAGTSGTELHRVAAPDTVLSICSRNRSGREVWLELPEARGAILDVMNGRLTVAAAVPAGCPTALDRADATARRVNANLVRSAHPVGGGANAPTPFLDGANGAWESAPRRAVVGVDALTGAELWTRAVPAGIAAPFLLGLGQRSVFVADRTATGAPALACLEAETGAERWKLVSPDAKSPGAVFVGRRRAYIVRGAGADVVDLSIGRIVGRIGAP
jgi:hypothetical protein